MKSKVYMVFITLFAAGVCSAQTPQQKAKQILSAAGVKGGLVVHIGCDEGKLTAALRDGDSYLVHGLDDDAADVQQAREYVRSRELSGAVSISQFDGKHLPFVDNLVNLVVVNPEIRIPKSEIQRVLAPDGVAIIGDEMTVKPRPSDIDEWTHYLHDPTNNAVAEDKQVGPPRHMQWKAGPQWTRNHHRLNSVTSMVSAGGRMFYIIDEATAANMSVPGKWRIVARDAFSGVLLWKKPIDSWAHYRIRFRSGPPQVTRLLVADGDNLYVPLGLGRPISKLDATTGETLATFKTTDTAEEIILSGDMLLVLTGSPVPVQARQHPAFSGKKKISNTKTLHAIDIAGGEELWRWSPDNGAIRPETLASDGRRAYAQVSDGVVCLDMKNGRELWTYGNTSGKGGINISFGIYTLVVADDVVVCNISGSVRAVSAEDGKELWKVKANRHGFHAPLDIFVINKTVWLGTNRPDSGRRPAPPAVDDFNEGLDLHTGKPKMRNSILADLQTVGHHHRCHREKATSRYIITGKRGVEMMDLTGNNHSRNNWVRGTCQYGVMPANGLLYTPPHSCGCYMESKLRSFWAIASDRKVLSDASRAVADDNRLEKGPTYGKIPNPKLQTPKTESADWTTYRHDVLRRGVVQTEVPQKLTQVWSADVGGELTQPVIADGKIFVSAKDENTVYALDEKNGQIVWNYTCGGPVDSPPTIYNGAVLFGSADGYVYCLRASDGRLAWRFNCAPTDLRGVSYGRVESLWPVHGSVLVLNGAAYCSAGRSTWLDDGIYLYAIDPESGKMLHKRHLASQHPKFKQGADQAGEKYQKRIAQNSTDYKTFLQSDRSDAFSMAGGTISDVLVSNGKDVFLHQVRFDAGLHRTDEMSAHLFSTSSLLDDTENHRSHWMLGTGDFSRVAVAYSWIVNSGGGFGQKPANPYGVIMVFDDEAAWGVHRNGRADGRYTVFRRKNKSLAEYKSGVRDIRKIPKGENPYPYVWKKGLNLRPRALVKAGGRLFLGATPTNISKDDPHSAYEGRMGGMILVFDAEKAGKLAEVKLDSPVVWDGMSAAEGKLYVSTQSGKVVCFGK